MNMSNKVRNFINKYRDIAIKHHCLLILLHHTKKSAEQSTPSKNSLLGSQGLEAKARSVILLTRDPNDLNNRLLSIVKGNYISDDLKTHAYVINLDPDTLTFSGTDQMVAQCEISNPVNLNDSERERKIVRAH